MQCDLSLDRQLIVNAGGGEELSATECKRGTRVVVAIPVWQAGVRAVAEIAGLQLKAVFKDTGEYDQTPSVEVTGFAWDADRTQYEATANFNTEYLNGRFGIQAAAVTLSSGNETTDLITADGDHNLSVGMRLWFPTLVGGTGLIAQEGQWYYVIADGLTNDDFKVSLTAGGAAVNFSTAITGGTFRIDPADVASIDLMLGIAWRFDSGDDWTEAENDLTYTLRNNIIRDDDGAPADPAADAALSWLADKALLHSQSQALGQASRVRLIENAQFVCDALTGGAAGALDSVETADGAVSTGRILMAVVSGVLSFWQLQAGTTAEDAAAGVVRPDDYDGSTNARVWIRIL